MPSLTQRNGTAGDGDSLILTPSKLRLHSWVFGPYITCLWLPNAILAYLLLLKIGYAVPIQWWLLFLPHWIGHAGHAALVVFVLSSVDTLVQQQLGPAPPATASPGMILQYNTMFSERKRSLFIDNVNGLIESAAALLVKVAMCSALTKQVLSSPTFSWRLLLLPCWISWGLTFVIALCKPKRERTFGSMRDLLYICLLFVALKLDGLAAYTWSVVFLIPWMWFGALFLGAVVTAGVIIVAYACMDLRELALPGGFLLLLLSAAAQLPFFIFLCNYLDGDTSIGMKEILLPQVASWAAMWVSGLIICYGLRKKEQLRARLASNGQVWTAHENAARELMSLELEDMQEQVDKMSNEELAQVAMRMMEGKAQPQQLMRVGSTLYRRALSFTVTSPKPLSVIRGIEEDGTAQLSSLTSSTSDEVRGWTISPIPCAEGEVYPLDEGSVRVDLQLMLPSVASRKGSKLLPAALADGSTSSGSSCYSSAGSSSLASQAGDAEDAVGSSAAEAVVLQVRPEAAAAASKQAAAAGPLSPLAHSSSCPSSFLTAAVAAAAAAAGSEDADDEDEGLCTICYDQPATCVLMECGHGGYCWRCAHLLFARPPSECPVCRQPIMQVLELEDPSCQVGRRVRVKPPTHRLSRSGGSGSWFLGR